MATPPRSRPRRGPPVPVALGVDHLLPRGSAVLPHKWARHEHTAALLHVARLEILVRRNRVLYAADTPTRTTHPRWWHLEERLPLRELSAEDYATMVARVSVVVADDGSAPPATTTTTTAVVLQVPIHPSRLARLGDRPTANQGLPPNAVRVTFSDGSVRVAPALYQALRERGLLVGPPPTPEEGARPAAGRFGDEAFHELDGICPGWASAATGNLLDAAMADEDDHDTANDDDDPSVASPPRGRDAAPPERGASEGDGDGDGSPPLEMHEEEAALKDDRQGVLEERQRLQRLVQQEAAALEQDLARLARGRDALAAGLEALRTVRSQTEEVRADHAKLRGESERSRLLLEVQQIRLFRELRTVYPITLVAAEERYRIRDLEIPPGLGVAGAAGAPDDEAAAALGYLSHLLTMMGKYLAVQYRYRIYYQASRSAVQDDRGFVFPLFLDRHIERDQFERGVRLLGHNVDCLVQARNVRVSPKLHMLGKVKRVYESVIDGY